MSSDDRMKLKGWLVFLLILTVFPLHDAFEKHKLTACERKLEVWGGQAKLADVLSAARIGSHVYGAIANGNYVVWAIGPFAKNSGPHGNESFHGKVVDLGYVETRNSNNVDFDRCRYVVVLVLKDQYTTKQGVNWYSTSNNATNSGTNAMVAMAYGFDAYIIDRSSHIVLSSERFGQPGAWAQVGSYVEFQPYSDLCSWLTKKGLTAPGNADQTGN